MANIQIAVLSGKGGTGKTLLAVNMAVVAGSALYVDCDVEAPNGRLFLKPVVTSEKLVTQLVPRVDELKCVGCRRCVEFCRYNALAFIGGKVKAFDDICHSCGGCAVLCGQQAILEETKPVGVIESGSSRVAKDVRVVTGILNTGEASGVPVIKELIARLPGGSNPVIVDCPPGSACVVMESIQQADYCVLVAEPTIFGAHNLTMVHQLVQLFNKPFGVVLNKCQQGSNPSEAYCQQMGLNILASLPYDKKIAAVTSGGGIIVEQNNHYRRWFEELLSTIEKEAASHEAASNS